jgi:hypothetical protein
MIGTKSRIFKVIKTPVELSQHPPVVQGLLGYEFFKLDIIVSTAGFTSDEYW